MVKSAKLYIFKDKLISFKMKDDESIPEMFHKLQVIINDLKALGEKINNDDVGVESDQHVNICSFVVRCDWMWPSTQ